jgi:hypothetical protein
VKVSFAKSVGVAPGTTTMTLGEGGLRCLQLGEGCPPDPVRYYTDPPQVQTSAPAAAKGGVMTIYDPYGTESQLKSVARAGLRGVQHGLHGLQRGLRGLGEARPGVAVVAAALAFAGVLGYGLWKRSR